MLNDMEEKHTKGAWIAQEMLTGDYKIDSIGKHISLDGKVNEETWLEMAVVNNNPTRPCEAAANAKIMAASLDLLKAAKKAASYIMQNCEGDYEKTPWRDLVDAIYKAEKK